MTTDEALAIVEQALREERLSKLQLTILRSAWEQQSYLEIARKSGYELGYVKQTGSQLWQILSLAFGEKVTKNNIQVVVKRKAFQAVDSGKIHHQSFPETKIDWGEATDIPLFLGRETEISKVEQWIGRQDCRVAGLFGMGGIGKTSLAIKLSKKLQSQFQFVIWRSLYNAPPILDLLADLIGFFSHLEPDLPASLEGRFKRLLELLRRFKCLVILDNWETVLQPGTTGEYLPGYEGYDQLLRGLADREHGSTLIVTSREKPKILAIQEGENSPVRCLKLNGLTEAEGQNIFQHKGEFLGTDEEWEQLVQHYRGNPLALKMIAPVIQDLFAGKIGEFLQVLEQGTSVFGDIKDLVACQIDRLSNLEQQVMYWLAIEREPVSLSALRSNFIPLVNLGELIEAIASLERRCLIEKHHGFFTLQPVVMEYLTDRLIEESWQELEQETARLPSLKQYALIKATAKDYIRETQIRLILKPILKKLICRTPAPALEAKFQAQVEQLRGKPLLETGYCAGNLLNLLGQWKRDLSQWNFADLSICQADFGQINLQGANFQNSRFHHSIFGETWGQILSIAFSADGQYLATGDINHEIHVWQVSEGKRILSCRVDEGWVWGLAFSPNGQFLASSANRVVKFWDLQTGDCLDCLGGYGDRIFSLAFSADGRYLATGSEDALIRIWDVKTRRLLHTLTGHTDEVRSVVFSPQSYADPRVGYLLASGSYDGNVRLWEIPSGDCLRVLQGHTDWVWSVDFSPDGQTLASSSSDRTIKLWDITTGQTLSTLSGHPQQIRHVAFSPDGKTLASGGDDRQIRLWHYPTGSLLRVLKGHRSWISTLTFSPDGQILASGSEDQSVRLWETRSYHCLKTLRGHSNGLWSVVFHPEKSILASGSQDGVIRLWDGDSGRCLHQWPGHQSWVWSVVFSPDGQTVASGSEDRSLKLWDTATGELRRCFLGHGDAVFSLVFSPDGRRLISGSLDGRIKIWEMQTGNTLHSLQGHQGGVWALALSGDGQLLMSGSRDRTLKLWNPETGQLLTTLSSHESWIRCCAISPHQQYLVSGSSDGVLKLWQRLENLEIRLIATLSAHRGPVLSLMFHPDGQFFASSGADGLIKLWDSDSGKCLQTLTGHEQWVPSVAFNSQGDCLASGSQDETIRLWTVSAEKTTPDQRLQLPRPYEGMNITGATGLTPAQVAALHRLGAVCDRAK